MPSIEVRYPDEWLPLFEGFASEDRLHLPGGASPSWPLLVFLLTDQAFRRLGLPSRHRVPSAALLTLAALVSREAAWAILAADVAVIALAFAGSRRRITWTASRIALAAGLAALSGIAILVYTASAPVSAKRELGGAVSATRGEPQEESASKSRQSVALPKPADEASGYQGLPARFEMPGGAHRSRFTREMLAADGPRDVRFFAISKQLAFWLGLPSWSRQRRRPRAGRGARSRPAGRRSSPKRGARRRRP